MDFNVVPGGTASSTNKTIGMYFDTAVKGKTTFVDNTLDMTNGKVVVTNKRYRNICKECNWSIKYKGSDRYSC